jgi:hypothetical protein
MVPSLFVTAQKTEKCDVTRRREPGNVGGVPTKLQRVGHRFLLGLVAESGRTGPSGPCDRWPMKSKR